MLEQQAGGVPAAVEERFARGGGQRSRERRIPPRQRIAARSTRSPRTDPARPASINASAVRADAVDARHAERDGVAEEDLRERLARRRRGCPRRWIACGACSREEPQPKFALTTSIDAPPIAGSSKRDAVPAARPAAGRPRTGVLEPVEGDRLQEPRRDDAVGVDVVAAQRAAPVPRDPTDRSTLRLTSDRLNSPHVHDLAGDRGRRHHRRAHQQRAAGRAALPALEIAVRRRRADLAAFELDPDSSPGTSSSRRRAIRSRRRGTRGRGLRARPPRAPPAIPARRAP